jgi:hypothetical protein
MNCGFCGCSMAGSITTYPTCWSCGVGYTDGKLVEYVMTGRRWETIPEGCLMVLNKCTEEIK